MSAWGKVRLRLLKPEERVPGACALHVSNCVGEQWVDEPVALEQWNEREGRYVPVNVEVIL